MGHDKQVQLCEDEVRAVLRLLAGALTPEDGRTAKVRRLGDGLAEMIGADGWIWIRTRLARDPQTPPANIDYVMGGGFDSDTLAEYADWSLEVYGQPPENPPMRRLLAGGGPFTRTRPELVSDAVWGSGLCRRHVDRMKFDAFMYSLLPVVERGEATVFSGVLMLRRPGRPEFDDRLARIAHLVVSECGPLHIEGLDVELGEAVAGLTPRLHSVLSLLIDGQTALQIADRLCLSPHTVRDYVKAIYRHFAVCSRAELMHRFLHGGRR